jgi:glycolate oxidase iron-sulfur subunit
MLKGNEMAVATEADLRILGNFSGPDIPELELLRACVHCGMCLASCPTYRMTGQEMSSPRGRLWLMSAVAGGRLELDDPVFQEQMYQCLNCRACEAVCPSGVQYGPLVESSRQQLEQHLPRPVWQRAARKVALEWLFSDVRRLNLLATSMQLYEQSGLRSVVEKSGVLRLLSMEDLDQMMPQKRGRRLIPGRERWIAKKATHTVQLFNGCVMGTVFPETNRAAARVLARNHASVMVPRGQGCCGALQVHSGMFEVARQMARANIDAFEGSDVSAIIVTAAGCGSTLKEYGHLLKDDPEFRDRAEAFSRRVKDVTEHLSAQPLETPGHLDRRVTYQEPCHLAHAQRITSQPRSLIKAIPGVKLVEMRESSLCCGSAGIYNVIRRDMATALGDRKAEHVVDTVADEVITANPGCAIQLRASLDRAGSPMRVTHIADLLDEAYGGSRDVIARRVIDA